MKKNMRNTIVLFLIPILTMTCTKNSDEDLIKKYGIEYNSVRKKIGLELIPNNFMIGFCTKKGDDFQINYLIDTTLFDKNKFVIPAKIIKPKFIMKTVWLSKNKIEVESDVYIHPSCHYASDSQGERIKVNNQIYIEYHFYNHAYYRKGWVYIQNLGSSGGMSKYEADSVLNSWGLHRPQAGN